jgi:hypothetical protein
MVHRGTMEGYAGEESSQASAVYGRAVDHAAPHSAGGEHAEKRSGQLSHDVRNHGRTRKGSGVIAGLTWPPDALPAGLEVPVMTMVRGTLASYGEVTFWDTLGSPGPRPNPQKLLVLARDL